MNDLQAQLEEVSKEKQELQEKVGSSDIGHGHAPRVKPGEQGGTERPAAHTMGGPSALWRVQSSPMGSSPLGWEQRGWQLCSGAAWRGAREVVVKAEAVLPLQLQGLQSQLEFLEQSMVDKSLVSRQEAKIRELESRLEFERTQVKRLEVGAGQSLRSSWDRAAAGPS